MKGKTATSSQRIDVSSVSCSGALLLVVLTSFFNSVLLMYYDGDLHISDLFIRFVMDGFVLTVVVSAHKYFL